MDKKKYLFFDLDDTLIKTQESYDLVIEKTGTLVKDILNTDAISLKDILEKMNEIDVAQSLKLGLGKERFPTSWVETLRYFSFELAIPITSRDEENIYQSAESVFKMIFPTYEETHETLKIMKEMGYEMNILTAGEDDVQRKRIIDAGISHYFDDVYIVIKKDEEAMKAVIAHRSCEDCIMIGNSLRSDIHPALSNGMVGVHIERKTWSYDHYDIDQKHANYHYVSTLSDIPTIIKKLG